MKHDVSDFPYFFTCSFYKKYVINIYSHPKSKAQSYTSYQGEN